MYIVRFWGGLGNQIFQYAFMRRLEIEHPNAEVYADLTDYRRIKYHHGFELEKIFGIKLREADDKNIARIGGRYVYQGPIRDIIHRIKSKVNVYYSNKPDSLFSVVDKSYEFALEGLSKLSDEQDVYFEGFWQRFEFFSLAANAIKKECKFIYQLRPELKNILSEIEHSNSVAVHVRRGDYIGTSFDVVGLDYYEKAITYMSEVNKDTAKLKFFFFSDDVPYIKANFEHITNKIIVDINHGDNAYMDMFLMSKCHHNIIAYSSFSYWGAYFNENNDKVVIAPQIGVRKSIQRLSNEGWILL